MSDLGNISGGTVFETVGDLDGPPCSSGGSHEGGKFSVLLCFPSGVGSLLGGNEGVEFGGLVVLGIITGLEGSLGVSIEVFLSSDNPGVPFSLKSDELSLEVSVDSGASGISCSSGGSEGLVEGVLAVVVPDGGDGPSDFLLLSIEGSNLADVSIVDILSGISESLVNSGSSGCEGSSPCGGLCLNISGHGSPL